MEYVLGSVSAPPHSRAIEAHTDQVAHGSLDGAAADVEVVTTKVVVVETALVLGQMLADLAELVALGLGAGAGLGDVPLGGGQRIEDLLCALPFRQV